MNELTPRLPLEEVTKRWSNFNFLMQAMGSEAAGMEQFENDKAINEIWRKTLPTNDFGELSLRQATSDFVKGFKSALETGVVESYINDAIGSGYDSFYVACGAGGTKSERAIYENHLGEKKKEYEENLKTFEEQLAESNLPPPVSREYAGRVRSARAYIERMSLIASKELTPGQWTPLEWGRLIDYENVGARQEMRLRHEVLAIELLEELREAQPVFKDIEKAFLHLNVSDAEKEFVIGSDVLGDKLLPSQGQRWIYVLMKRMRISEGWKIEEVSGGKPLFVSAKSKRLKFPVNRELTPDGAAFNASHEAGHCVRGANGDRQDNVVASEGTDDYVATEEGLMVLLEAILGQPFIHERKQIFAARYLAASMAMKTQEIDGRKVAKHSVQDIYDSLKGYGVSRDNAGDIIWRLFRGTSLKQEIVTITAEVKGETGEYQIPECYVKDTVYLVGMMKVFEWVSAHLPFDENERAAITTEARDYSNRTLARLGRAVMPNESYTKSEAETLKEWYRRVVFSGRETMLYLANYLGVGKLSLEALESDEWRKILNWQKNLDYRNIMRPLSNEQVEDIKKQEWLIPLE